MTNSEILLYKTEDGQTKIDVRLEEETVWLSQVQMAELFQTTKQNISLHIKNVFEEGELEEISIVKDYLTVQTEGKRDVQRKTDVSIAKNYLTEDELINLNLIVEQYLSFAELRARNREPIYMSDWLKKLNDFMTLNEKEIIHI